MVQFMSPSPGLTPGTSFAIAGSGKDGVPPAQSAVQRYCCTACMSLTLTLWKRLLRAQRLSEPPAKTFPEPASQIHLLPYLSSQADHDILFLNQLQTDFHTGSAQQCNIPAEGLQLNETLNPCGHFSFQKSV